MSTTQALAAQPQPKASALSIMAGRYNVEPNKLLSTLKSTVFKGATDDELLALVVVSNEYSLNPLLKEIYAFPAKMGGIVPVVSIDGWINRMNSNPAFDGIEFEDVMSDGKVFAITAKIFRKDRSRPTVVTEYLSECFRATDPWRQYPARMLRHKALMQCVRVAFGFGGVYDEEEARDIAFRDVTPTPATAPVHRLPVDFVPGPEPEGKPPQIEEPAITTDPSEKEAEEARHAAAVAKITELLSKGGVNAMEVREFAVANKLAPNKSTMLVKYPASALETIANRWDELLKPVEAVEP
jgi:phage recombination protein Bet